MNIVVCTLAINDWYRDIVKYALRNIEYYSNKYNYKCIIETENTTLFNYDKTRAPCWYKIKLIEYILENIDCDYIFWIDADSQILKHDVKIEYFIEKYFEKDTELVLTQDTNILNTGVMFIKKSDFNILLMKKIWNTDETDYFKDFHEQTSLANIWSNNDNIRKSIKVIPYGVKDEIVVYWSNYYPGNNFILHCARCSGGNPLDFMYMMDCYCPLKLDEESEEEYTERIKWLITPELCRKDIDYFINHGNLERKYSARCKKFFEIK